MRFGWLNSNHTYETDSVKISVLDDFQEAIAKVTKSSNQDGEWFYPPITCSSAGLSVPASRYELPFTHLISQKKQPENEKFIQFIILYFGWLNGVRLNPEGWGHLNKSAIKLGSLVDFVVYEQRMPLLLTKGEEFWQTHQHDQLADTMFGAIHWYFFAHSYTHYFERFMAQYMVMDTLYKITSVAFSEKEGTHAKRIEFISKKLNLFCPTWGSVVGKDTEIAGIRNNLLHESKFAGMAIGFNYEQSHSHILLELEAFNCRVIAALMGARGDYSQSSCQTRQRHAFDFN